MLKHEYFINLSVHEKDALLKFPAYISLLAAECDDKLDEEEKKAAIKLSHIKTFSCDPLLAEFYKESDIADKIRNFVIKYPQQTKIKPDTKLVFTKTLVGKDIIEEANSLLEQLLVA